ncbi:MAG: hypothetical protein IJ503_05270 [Akkermansia sp.]|nr:hypothetical protein [Akkermansia sp.]
MNDADLIKKVKEQGFNEKKVRKLLLDLLQSGDITTEQLKNVLDKPSDAFPLGLHFNKNPRFITVSPSFVTSVICEFKRRNGNKKAYCC